MEVEKSSSASGVLPEPPPLIPHGAQPPLRPEQQAAPPPAGSAPPRGDGRRDQSPSQQQRTVELNAPRAEAEPGLAVADTMPSTTRERGGSGGRGDQSSQNSTVGEGEVLDKGNSKAGKNCQTSSVSSRKGKEGMSKSKSPPSVASAGGAGGKTKQAPSIMSSLKSKKGAKPRENNSIPRFVNRGPDSDSDADEVPLNVLREARRASPSIESAASKEGSQRPRKAQTKGHGDQNKTSGQRTNGVTAAKGKASDLVPSSSARTSALNGDSQAHKAAVEQLEPEKVKRKRGRPRKQQPPPPPPPAASAPAQGPAVSVSRALDLEHLNMPNVSPDSGIQSIAGSPLTHDREVPSPGHHHQVHPVAPGAHHGLHFPDLLQNPANFNAFPRFYHHLNPGIASLYPHFAAAPFSIFPHPAVNFQQAFLNFANNQRFSSVGAGGPRAVEYSAPKQPGVPLSKSSDDLNIVPANLQPHAASSRNTKSTASHQKSDKHNDKAAKQANAATASQKPTQQSEQSKEPVTQPVKKRGRTKNLESTAVQSSAQESEQTDKTGGGGAANSPSLPDKSRTAKSLAGGVSSPRSSPKHSVGEKPKRGRQPRDAARHKQLKSPPASAAVTSSPLAYLSTAPVATSNLPGSNKRTSEALSVSIPSAQSLVPKDSAIALATSFPGTLDTESSATRKSPPQSQMMPSTPALRAALAAPAGLAARAQSSQFAGTPVIGLPPKKKRGRPRKNPLPEDGGHQKNADANATSSVSPKSSSSQMSRDSAVSPNSSFVSASSAVSDASVMSAPSSVPIIPKTTKKTPIVAPSSFGHAPPRPATSAFTRKRYKSGNAGSDTEILSLAQNVQESLNSKFTSEDEFNSSSENLERSTRFLNRNIFTDMNQEFQQRARGKPSLLHQHQTRKDAGPENSLETGATQGSDATKKKPKKPKLHVMMRKPKKRGRKKKVASTAVETEEPVEPVAAEEVKEVAEPPRKPAAKPASPRRREKTAAAPKAASGRTKARSGRSENSDSGMTTDTSDMDRSSGAKVPALSPVPKELPSSDNRSDQIRRLKSKKKKKKQKLYMKSKHKNIVDPVFLADLEGCTQDLGMMAISENPEHYLMRLQPGEIPLPSMFKIHRLIVKRRRKNKDVHLSKFRRLESKKDYADFAAVVRERSKRGRKKKFLSEEYVSEKEEDESHVNVEQCLPPKKRHKLLAAVENEPLENPTMRMGSANEPIVLDLDEPASSTASTFAGGDVSSFAAAGSSASPALSTELPFSAKPGEKRKVGRPRKNQSQTAAADAETCKEKSLPPPPPLIPLSGKNVFLFPFARESLVMRSAL